LHPLIAKAARPYILILKVNGRVGKSLKGDIHDHAGPDVAVQLLKVCLGPAVNYPRHSAVNLHRGVDKPGLHV
jgi:hypothetical protein